MRYDLVVTTGPVGTISRIARYSIHDGPGIRTTVFFKGCPLRCWWCHSPESQQPGPQLALKPDRCVRCGACVDACPEHAASLGPGGPSTDRALCRSCGACAALCPSGAREITGVEMTVDAVMAEIEKDVVFFEQSGGGVTFSGGEPLVQPDFLEAVLRRARAAALHTAVDTCGYAEASSLARVIDHTNLFLFDLKAIDEARHVEITGVSNRPILDNLRLLTSAGAAVRVRFPLVSGVNDDSGDVETLAAFVKDIGLFHVDVLPYHRAGLAKYERYGLDCRLPDLQPPGEASVERVVAIFRHSGLEARIGG